MTTRPSRRSPKDSNKKSKVAEKYTYHWCMRHMAWCMHFPTNCHLGKEWKEEYHKPKSTNVANTTYTTAAASLVNPHFQALHAAMENGDENE